MTDILKNNILRNCEILTHTFLRVYKKCCSFDVTLYQQEQHMLVDSFVYAKKGDVNFDILLMDILQFVDKQYCTNLKSQRHKHIMNFLNGLEERRKKEQQEQDDQKREVDKLILHLTNFVYSNE
jgi:hypothetical protein